MYFVLWISGTCTVWACHEFSATKKSMRNEGYMLLKSIKALLVIEDLLLSFAWNSNEDRRNLWHQKWPFSLCTCFVWHISSTPSFSERLISFCPRAKWHGQSWQRRGPNCFDDKSDDKSQLYKRSTGPVQSYAVCVILGHLQSVKDCKRCILHCVPIEFYQLWFECLENVWCSHLDAVSPAVHTLHGSS